ncbi:MAG: tol-pal system YbgF family protein [Flavobacteriaceae bacterium]
MSLDETTYQEIADYLAGAMDKDTLSAFEDRLAKDAKLRDTYELFQKLGSVYNTSEWNMTPEHQPAELAELTKTFASDEVAHLSKTIRESAIRQNTVGTSTKRRWWYAASVGVAAVLVALFYLSRPLSPQAAFEKYHNWDTLPGFTTKSDAQDLFLSKVENTFRAKQYEKALLDFTEYQKTHKTYNPNVQLYIGVCQLELSQYEAAIKTFTLLGEAQVMDSHKSYWYLAMTYLKKGDLEPAKDALKELTSQKTHYKYDEAKALLQELK